MAIVDKTIIADAAGDVLDITAANAAKVDGSAVTHPVSLATLPALTAGSALVGKVGIDQTTPGTTNLVALAANQSVNVAQMNGVATTMGNGVAGTGVQRVAIASDNTAFSVNNTLQKAASPVSTTLQNAAVANGNGTNLAVDGYSTAIVSITAAVAMSGGTTINFEVSTDNTTFVSVSGINVGTTTIATTTTATGDWKIDVTGYSFFRARISAYSAGTITIKGYPIAIAAGNKVINANIVSNTATNQSTNIAQMNGVTVSMGTGVMGTGVQRVAIASDNDALTVKQATAANLNATVVGTGTFVVQNTNAAETTKVLGTVRVQGNVGGVLDAVSGAAVPANAILVGGGSIAGGTNITPLTVKAASTAVAATDTSLVVQALINNAVMSTAASGVQKVGIVGNTGATLDAANGGAVPTNGQLVGGGSVGGGTNFTALTVKAASTAVAATDTSLVTQALINNAVMSTAASGVQKVGIVGNAGAIFDAASGGAVPANLLMVGGGSVGGGTNLTPLTVKVASVAAAATDTSVVTQLNPAQPAVTTAGVFSVKVDQTTVGTTNAVSLAQVGATTVATGNGVVSAGVQRVAIASDNTAFAVIAAGDIAHDAVDSGNPVKIGFKALSALPTAVATADRANGISDLYGRQLVGHIDPAMQIWKSYNSTASIAAGSAAIIWTPAAGKKICLTSISISTYGTTAARMFLFFAAAADLTYSAGTDQPVFIGSFAPSATTKPGTIICPSVPIIANTADYKLLYQNDAALSVDIVVHGYEV